MITVNAWRRRVLLGCVGLAMSCGAAACGDEGDDTGEPAPVTDRETAAKIDRQIAMTDHGRPPKPERRQSAEESRLFRMAWELQNAHANRDYEKVCAMLSDDARFEAEALGETCASGIAVAARDRDWPRPKIVWVRVRGRWATVVSRKPDGNMSLTSLIRENGSWRFTRTGVTGVDWP